MAVLVPQEIKEILSIDFEKIIGSQFHGTIIFLCVMIPFGKWNIPK